MNTQTNDIRMTGDYQRKVNDLVNREVLTGVNELMQTLLKSEDIREGEYSEELISICGTEDYSEPVIYTIKNADDDDIQDYINWVNDPAVTTKQDLLDQINNDDCIDINDFCNEFNIEPYQSETLEYWVVSSWFADQLKDHNENVQEILGLTIWGRTCTGQAILLDWVISKICDDLDMLK